MDRTSPPATEEGADAGDVADVAVMAEASRIRVRLRDKAPSSKAKETGSSIPAPASSRAANIATAGNNSAARSSAVTANSSAAKTADR